jgi:hypothetical protein
VHTERSVVASTADVCRRLDREGAVSIGEQDLGTCRAELGVLFEGLDERPQPARLHGRVVVDERDVRHRSEVAQPEVAPAGEAAVRLAAHDSYHRQLALDPLGDSVRGGVVDEHDLEPGDRPVGPHEAAQALHREVTALEVEDDHTHERRRLACRGHPPVSAATSRSSDSR